MAVRAVDQMRRGTNQDISMTGTTVICTGCRYQAAVVWCGGMDRTPTGTMTCRTVSTRAE